MEHHEYDVTFYKQPTLLESKNEKYKHLTEPIYLEAIILADENSEQGDGIESPSNAFQAQRKRTCDVEDKCRGNNQDCYFLQHLSYVCEMRANEICYKQTEEATTGAVTGCTSGLSVVLDEEESGPEDDGGSEIHVLDALPKKGTQALAALCRLSSRVGDKRTRTADIRHRYLEAIILADENSEQGDGIESPSNAFQAQRKRNCDGEDNCRGNNQDCYFLQHLSYVCEMGANEICYKHTEEGDRKREEVTTVAVWSWCGAVRIEPEPDSASMEKHCHGFLLHSST
ncbi:hypothetical protein JRO89_XS03G0024700 [Xanthoceras sorbifolium]|uniref:Uncharacterized protein n=1 Tax=Xanthoceras sorbifolium TaxID=99658 RepID=A0ABQ8I887_9ROSI|nr:hypothetical protein JRO89_XS03G0024700 [Xanthoceras sorbifolium]